LVDFEEDG
jgi:hypothetical protein